MDMTERCTNQFCGKDGNVSAQPENCDRNRDHSDTGDQRLTCCVYFMQGTFEATDENGEYVTG